MPEPLAEGPDHFFVSNGPIDGQNRLPDGGPRYQETPVDPYADGAPSIAEPWNTITAALFILLALGWAWNIRRRWREYPFIVACLPVLLAGGVGGTLYHATRTQKLFFLMDVVPISLLGVAGSVYLIIRLSRGLGTWRIVTILTGVVVVYLMMNGLLFRLIQSENRNLRVNLSYASLALVILTPLVLVLWRTRFRHGRWVLVALGCFALAWFCRAVHATMLSPLPMGTHWLWHVFGGLTTHALIVYFARLESETW